MKNYDYIFFDFDGTLSDSAPGIISSVNYALTNMGLPEGDAQDLKKFVGPPLSESFRKYYGFSENETTEAIRLFRVYYQDKGIFENSMYDGVPQMLKKLSDGGKTLVIATSKPEAFAKSISDRYGIADFFHYIAGSVMDETRTEKSQVIEYALKTCGITDPSRVLMVGDRLHDAVGAAKCSVDCMGVLFGYGSRAELTDAGAKYIAETVADVAPMILDK